MPTSSKSTATATAATKFTGHHHYHQNYHSRSPLLHCKHSPSATRDLLFLILVLFSGTFLLSSYFSYIFHSLSLLLSPLLSTHSSSLSIPFVSYLLGYTLLFVTTLVSIEFFCGSRSRKCNRPGCKGLKKALEFDLQCLRAELRKMAPPNGRAVLLFLARCGCSMAKLEGWGAKRGRRIKSEYL
ncbi:Detected protein of confused Function [Hibiscus syriacus]|uniref:Detected protein of confused Function n=1 Tax=Hibiscus syriacus TaxID=106335 RepID=A0A6A2YH54_HIBSY|nr:Detected protein of confused Function [Hibiscus syriacus]